MRTVSGDGTYAIRTSSFQSIAELRDIYLTAGNLARPQFSADTEACYIVPIAGEVRFESAATNLSLTPGNVYQIPVRLLEEARFTNMFNEEAINVLVIETRSSVPCDEIRAFSLTLNDMNRMVDAEGSGLVFKVGVYDSRTRDLIKIDHPNSISLCYVINGSFEIAERLLEYKDALLLWDHAEVDFEALSEAAILLHINLTKSVSC